MSSHIINKLFNMSILCLLITIVYCRPIHTRCNTRDDKARCMPCTDRCPGSPEIKATLLEKFKQFDYCVTNETVIIHMGSILGLSAMDSRVKIAPPSDYNINCNDPEDIMFFFYKYQFTINGTKMMSLVPVGSPDLIVTWGQVDVGRGDINDTIITYELKTENITKVFEMISSNRTDYNTTDYNTTNYNTTDNNTTNYNTTDNTTNYNTTDNNITNYNTTDNNTTNYNTTDNNRTDYDINWLFQMDYSESLIYVKILTKECDLAVTYNNEGETTLTKKIAGVSQDNPDRQSFTICNDCPEDE